ncbi:hypothetical protein TorRG33x02_063710 [Trema orientale]|uniref:Uncharacterized protein n=1 Tax=Trema orientale TaxID=63057 RepID=A0A2P5FJ05_TREOI|nr:hypothetical protein TorRG33x02_063710 [Trema orientale]
MTESNGGSTPVEIFRSPVGKRLEQLGEAAGQVRPRSKIFDPSRAEAPLLGSGSGPVVAA